MIYTSAAEKTSFSGDNLTKYSTKGFITPTYGMSTITTCSKQKLSYLQTNLNKQRQYETGGAQEVSKSIKLYPLRLQIFPTKNRQAI